MGLKVTNNAYAVLNASITSSSTTIVLVAGQGARFPTLSAGDYFYATLIDTSNNLEIVKCTARSTDTLTVERGQDNSTARAYATNDRFELRPTAALFNEKANDADVTTALAGKVSLAGDSMTGQLNVHNSTQTNFASTLAESVSRATVKLRTHSTDSTLTTFGGITGGDAYIQRSNGSGTSEYDIRLNPFGGRVRMPNQTAFIAVKSTNQTPNTADTTKVTYDVTDLNIGGAYNTSTSRFTAPVAGNYLFIILFNPYNISNALYNVILYKNGGSVRNLTRGNMSSDSDLCLPSSVVLNLSANDYIEVYVQIADTAWGISAGVYWNSFSGYLLG